MTRILIVDHAPALGGAERSLLLLLKHLDRTCWRPHLACVDGPLAEEATALGVPVHVVRLPRLRRSLRAPLAWLGAAMALARLARRIDAALLVANTVRAAMVTGPGARLAGIPFVWHMRDFWLSEVRPGRLWADRLGKRLLCAAAGRVIVNSQATAAHLPCPDKVAVVHNGVEVERFDPAADGSSFRQQQGIPPDAPLVGTVGRLRPWKGQGRLLRALARVRDLMPEVWGLVVGGSPFDVRDGYPEYLRGLAADLGLGDHVLVTGQVADPGPALAAIDLFVHPGDPEPFGLVNVEAMAMGRPVVAFRHGALPEIVVDGETGLLVPPDDEAALAQAIVTLLREPARREAMGRAGRERVERYFTAQRMSAGVAAVFDDLLASRGWHRGRLTWLM